MSKNVFQNKNICLKTNKIDPPKAEKTRIRTDESLALVRSSP